MKKILLVTTGLLPMVVSAQMILSDNFESYTAGQPLAANSALWTTWSGGISSEDANVSNAQASSGSNSVYIVGNTGPTDLILPFPSDYTSGVYQLSMKMYVVGGKGAYFNLQQSSVPGVNWMFELYLDNQGGGFIAAGGATPTVTYVPDEWNTIKIIVDLDNDNAEFFMNGASVYSWQWSLGSLGTGAEKMWGGMDVFAYAANAEDAEFYIDDVVLGATISCPEPTGLTVPSVTATNASVQWDAVADAIGYKITYHPVGVNTAVKKPSSGTSKVLKDLLPNTTYKWAVQSVCSNSPKAASAFVMGPDFTTPPQKLDEGSNAPYQIAVFPNPASANATITFSLDESSPVTIRLTDMNGKLIREIAHATYPAGNHQLSFDSDQLSSGVYLLQLTSNEEVATKKLMIEH